MRRFVLSLIRSQSSRQAAPDAVYVIAGRPSADELSDADRPRSAIFAAIRVASIPPSQLPEAASAG
jgi:hypothetical protein